MINLDQLDTLFYWITERENVRFRKLGSQPLYTTDIVGGTKHHTWTNDPILQHYRFCNVNREDDKVTKWIHDNIRVPYENDGRLWLNLVIARYINDISSLEQIGYVKEWSYFRFLNMWKRLKLKFGGAYIIPMGHEKGMGKMNWLCDNIFHEMNEYGRREPKAATCKQWYGWLTQFEGVGPFMGNQIVTDLKYTRYCRNAKDRQDFVIAGPGTRRGLNRLHDRSIEHNTPNGQTEAELTDLCPIVLDAIKDNVKLLPAWTAISTDLNNLSNCVCEFDKYMRAKRGEGHPKRRYP